MLPVATAPHSVVLTVTAPCIGTVTARAGDALVVRPDHADRPLVVLRRDGTAWRPVCVGPLDAVALAALCADGTIRPHSPEDAERLGALCAPPHHPTPAPGSSSAARPMLPLAAVPVSSSQHFDVTADHLLAFGLRARAGDALVVRPGHPTAPVVLIRRTAGRWRGIATGHEDADALARLVESGTLTRWRA